MTDYLKHVPFCKVCNTQNNIALCVKYDAYFCSECDSWAEDQCSDADCIFCPGRPEKPSLLEEEN